MTHEELIDFLIKENNLSRDDATALTKEAVSPEFLQYE